jgi:hypothetical protein
MGDLDIAARRAVRGKLLVYSRHRLDISRRVSPSELVIFVSSVRGENAALRLDHAVVLLKPLRHESFSLRF